MKIKGFIKIALMVLIVIMIFSSIAYADNDNFSFSEINNQTAGEDIKNPVKKAVGAVMGAVRRSCHCYDFCCSYEIFDGSTRG